MNIPTLNEIKKAGYTVDINHNRDHTVVDKTDAGKIVTKTIRKPHHTFTKSENYCMWELLTKGGQTEVIVKDNESNEFIATSECRNDENYEKAIGISHCLERIVGLMLVCDGQNGFKMRLTV